MIGMKKARKQKVIDKDELMNALDMLDEQYFDVSVIPAVDYCPAGLLMGHICTSFPKPQDVLRLCYNIAWYNYNINNLVCLAFFEKNYKFPK